MRVRIFQVSRERERLGPRKCPWSIEWRDPADDKKKSETVGSRKDAEKAADKKRSELVDRKHGLVVDETPWSEFVTKYKAEYVATELTSERSRVEVVRVIDRFTKLMQP